MNYGVKLWIALNSSECAVYSLQKIRAQAWAFLLVPKECVVDVRRCCRTDEYLHQVRRLLIRRWTSSHGMPTGPSRSSSSSLRSSSSRCGVVSGTALGLEERLSHSCSRSL